MALRAFDSLHLATCYCTNNGCGCALNLWRMRTDGLGNKLVSPGSTPTEDSPENPQLIRIIIFLLGVSPSLLSRLLSPGARRNDPPLQRQSIVTTSVPGTLSCNNTLTAPIIQNAGRFYKDNYGAPTCRRHSCYRRISTHNQSLFPLSYYLWTELTAAPLNAARYRLQSCVSHGLLSIC